MEKPAKIIEIEKVCDVNFQLISEIDFYDTDYNKWDYRNTYTLNESGEVISLSLITYKIFNTIDVFMGLSKLKFLNLSNNRISNIEGLSLLKDLIFLNLSYNNIDDITSIAACKKIEKLYLSGNRNIRNIQSLKFLKGLKVLKISMCDVIDFSGIKSLSSITYLEIANTKFKDSNIIESLINLESLNLGSTRITEISFMSSLKKLKSIILDDCFLVKDYKPISEVPELENLSLNRCNINEIDFLSNNKRLIYLDIGNTEIKDFTPLRALKNLKRLILLNTGVSNLNFIKTLKKLEILDLSGNSISNVDQIQEIITLKELYLHDNEIKSIYFCKKLISLNILNLSNNDISDISELSTISNLQELYLNNNRISSVKGLELLKNLNELHLFNNEIIEISSLKDLSKLDVLDIEDNSISDLSPIYGLIKSGLGVLEYTDPQLDKRIEIGSNPINIPPLEFIRMGNDTIIEYFEDTKKFGSQPINECKVIFIGDGSVGKTSLMKRLVSNQFNQEESTTHGINKIAWDVKCDFTEKPIKVNLWDFGGQHLQHSLHQFFLTKRVIYVLVLNPRNDERSDYWLKQIENLGGDSEVLVVYNWKNEKDKQASFLANYYELKKTYPYISEPILLSCKTNEGLSAFKHELKETIQSQANLNDEYPLNWFNIKNSLEEQVTLERNYISYEEYEKICEDNNYYDEERKKNLLNRLNNIGSIVFFEDPNLSHLQVLNPDWITTFAYSIITSDITNKKNGHLDFKDLREIFKNEKEVFSNKITKVKYRENQFDFILRLMKKYDLCQINPFNLGEHLFPSSFKGSPDEDYSNIKYKGKHYRFLFDTEFEMLIIHRFIARNIKNSASMDFWQSGIYINDIDKKTFSLIETNRLSKIINCWVEGENIRGLWELIRNDIKDICRIYDNLYFEEQVLYSKHGREIFLSYEEMIKSLRKGRRIIDWHPTHDIENIDVLNVLENFEDTHIIMEELSKQGIIINGNVSNSQIGGQKNTQSNYINHYADNNNIDQLKDILGDLEDVAKVNFEWQENFTNALTAIYKLEAAENEIEEKKQKTKLQRFFNKAKEVKDWTAITLLPADIMSKGGKVMKMGSDLLTYLKEIL